MDQNTADTDDDLLWAFLSNDDDEMLSLPHGSPPLRRSFRRQEQEELLSSIVEPSPLPEVMTRRHAVRQAMLEETLQHRRLHGGNIDNNDNDDMNNDDEGENNNNRKHDHHYIGRNICSVLRDRQRYGSSHRVIVKSNNKDDSSSKNEEDARQWRRKITSQRNVSDPLQVHREVQGFAEHCSVTKFHSSYPNHLGGADADTVQQQQQDNQQQQQHDRPPSSAVSTISIAFSPDSLTMASTHGDHTVKITCCVTGKLLRTLEGHPRTPWTVKYHPIHSHIVASGCLGCQVRVWDWSNKSSNEGTRSSCLHMIRLDHAIISLSFHPSGHVLAIASGSRLHFWDYDNYGARPEEQGGSINNNNNNNRGGAASRGALTEVEQRHMLRCVHFPPNGTTLIVGGTNPQTDEQRRRGRSGMSGGGMTFYLRLWDFDLDAALHPEQERDDARDVRNLSRTALRLQQRKALSNPQTFVPRALLYNDGGFDVSPDGRTLCCCAEYWLPDGVDSAMELLRREELMADESEDKHEIQSNDDTLDTLSNSSNQILSPRPQSSSDQGGGNSFESPNRQAVSTPVNSPPRRPMNGPPRPREPMPMTPPNPSRLQMPLSPPPPPGVRFNSNMPQQLPRINDGNDQAAAEDHGNSLMFSAPTTSSRYQPPQRAPHPLTVVSGSLEFPDVAQQPGRYVPHVVTVSLDTSPIMGDSVPPSHNRSSVARGHRPRLGQLLEAAPLDGSKAAAVTCVKFSPSADFCLLGYGVREPVEGDIHHPVTALYRVRGGMTHVATMLSGDDDVNIARFHPDSGYGFVYGTKQGRVRVLSPRPWNYYHC